MPFYLKPDGTVRTDTADEMMEWLKLQRGGGKVERERRGAASLRNAFYIDTNVILDFFASVDDPQQKKLLSLLAASAPKGLTDADVRSRLGLSDNTKLRGVLIGISKRAKGASLEGIIRKYVTRTNGGGRSYRYSLSKDAAAAIKGASME